MAQEEKSINLPQSKQRYENKAAEYCVKGLEEFERENYSEAISYFEEALDVIGCYEGSTYHTLSDRNQLREKYPELHKKDAEIYLCLGKAYLYNDDSEKSIKAFDNAIFLIELAPEYDDPKSQSIFHEYFFYRGLAYIKKSREVLGDYNASLAIKDLDKAIDLNDSLDNYYYHRGKAYFQYDPLNLDFSKEDLLKAIGINPLVADYYYWLGMVFEASNPGGITDQFRNAILCYMKALEVDPNHKNAHNKVASARDIFKNGEKEELDIEIKEMEMPGGEGLEKTILQGICNSVKSWLVKYANHLREQEAVIDNFEFGIEQFNDGKYFDAIDLFKKGIDLDSKNGLCYLYSGISYIFQYDIERARPFIEKALECELPIYYKELAEGLKCFHYEIHTMENIGKAWGGFDMGVFRNHELGAPEPKYTYDVFLYYHAFAMHDNFLFHRDDYNYNPVKYCDDAIRKNSNHAVYYYLRGRCLFQYKLAQKYDSIHANDAIKDFSKAIEMNQNVADFYFFRGKLRGVATVSMGKGFFAPMGIDKKGAIADIEQAISMDGSKAKYYFSLAVIYAELGEESSENYSQAVILFKKASDLEKDETEKNDALRSMVTVAKLGNIHIEEEYANIEPYDLDQQNQQLSGKEILSGIWDLAKKGLENMQAQYQQKTEKIDKYAEKYQNYDKDQLNSILQNSSVFEKKAAAKRLLQGMDG